MHIEFSTLMLWSITYIPELHFIQVHNGENGYAPVVANLCGKEAVQPIVTSGKAVYLHFTTDAANNARGFNISWESKYFNDFLVCILQ